MLGKRRARLTTEMRTDVIDMVEDDDASIKRVESDWLQRARENYRRDPVLERLLDNYQFIARATVHVYYLPKYTFQHSKSAHSIS